MHNERVLTMGKIRLNSLPILNEKTLAQQLEKDRYVSMEGLELPEDDLKFDPNVIQAYISTEEKDDLAPEILSKRLYISA